MAVTGSNKTQEELFVELLQVLLKKLAKKKLDSYQIEAFLKDTGGEKKPSGWEEIRILFGPRRKGPISPVENKV